MSRYENRSRYDLDLAPGEKWPRTGDIVAPLAWVALGLVALMAFLAWLLVGPPLQP